jgi:multiple sugar transport system permease protein
MEAMSTMATNDITSRATPTAATRSQGTRPRRPTRSGIEARQRRAAWLMVVPALLHNTIFLGLPVLMMVLLGFTNYSLLGEFGWVGLGNFQELWNDETFRAALLNTILYSLAVVPFAMALALLVAIGLNQAIRNRGFFRTLYYVPVVTATVAVGTVWLWIYEPEVGLANAVLGLIGLGPISWLTDSTSALPAVMLVGVWQGLGAKMVVYLAALQGVSHELKEAAQLDGAGRWQTFRHIVWPSLGAANAFVLVTSVVQSFQVFDLIYVMTRGGPGNSTSVLTFDVYQNAFQNLRLGYASAESVVMFLLTAIFVIVGLRLQRGRS